MLSYGDVIDPNSIIAEVKLKRLQKNTYSLPEKQRLLVEKQLRKSVAGLAPSSDDDDDDDDDGDDDGDEDVDDDEADDSVDDSDTSGILCFSSTFVCLLAACMGGGLK